MKNKMGRVFKWLWRKKWWILILSALVVAIMLIFGGGKSKKSEFVTLPINKGDLRQVVTATGEIQPVNTVSVGSQVSGTIDALYVDYNSKVKKGDLLLTIEPSVLQASVDEAKASLISAKHCTPTGILPAPKWNSPKPPTNRRSSLWRAPARSMNARKQTWAMRRLHRP